MMGNISHHFIPQTIPTETCGMRHKNGERFTKAINYKEVINKKSLLLLDEFHEEDSRQ